MTGEMDVEDGDDDDDVDSEAEEEAAEEAAEEAEAADAAAAAADRQQQHDGGATESPVSSIAETRSRLLKDRVAEITYRDEPGVYLALVTETPAPRANKVSHLWLHEVLDGSDLYIMDPWNRGESKSPIRKVAKPLSSVQELPPAEAGQALAGEALRFALDAIRSDPGSSPARADPPSSATATALAPPPPPPLSTARPPPALPAPPPPRPPPRPLAPPRMRPLAVLLAPPRPVRLPSPQKLGSASRGQS